MNLKDLLIGIAVADAIGNPLEFQSVVSPEDVEQVKNGPTLCISDDTQMTLFIAESLGREIPDGNDQFASAYLRWLFTQKRRYSPGTGGGLLEFPELYSQQAPGLTCMKSLEMLVKGEPVINDSKGNGTVMRCAPIAPYSLRKGLSNHQIMRLAQSDALVTHKHPYATYSSQFQCLVISYLMVGIDKDVAVGIAQDQMLRGAAVSESLPQFLQLIATSLGDEVPVMKGWVAEEALCLALHAFLHHSTYEGIVEAAICTSEDSDTVAAIAGALAAAHGINPPAYLVQKLNCLGPIEYVSSLPFWR